MPVLDNVMVGAYLRDPQINHAREHALRTLELAGAEAPVRHGRAFTGHAGPHKRLEIARVLATLTRVF